jgi:hypothetical protein
MTANGKENNRLTVYVNKAIFSIEMELANNCKLKMICMQPRDHAIT